LHVSEPTDEQLAAEAVREGSDGPAFVELIRRHQDRIWRVCYRLMGDAHDAQDAAQEVMVRMFTNRAQFQGRSRYSTWVHGVAIRTCLALRRGRGRRQRRVGYASDEMLANQPGEESTSSGLSSDTRQMLDTLDENDRAMLILKHAENYTYDDLAEMFELSTSACKMRVSRAREKLRQQFPDA
jgi:RNA polymerase sigma-70 factor (ECF subfamily)